MQKPSPPRSGGEGWERGQRLEPAVGIQSITPLPDPLPADGEREKRLLDRSLTAITREAARGEAQSLISRRSARRAPAYCCGGHSALLAHRYTFMGAPPS